jgi:hypothetical protein
MTQTLQYTFSISSTYFSHIIFMITNNFFRPGAIEEMRRHRDAHHLPAPRGTNATSPIIYTPQDSSQRNAGK